MFFLANRKQVISTVQGREGLELTTKHRGNKFPLCLFHNKSKAELMWVGQCA